MTQSKDNAHKGAAVDAIKTKREAEAALSRKQADEAVRPSSDSPKRQGDKLANAANEAAKR